MKKRITSLVLLLACGVVEASDWVQVGASSNNGELMLVDVSSVLITDGMIRRVWTKIVYLPQTETRSNKWIAYDMSRWAFNCNEQTGSAEAFIAYYEIGTNEVASWTPTSWQPIPPGTVNSAAMQFICAWKRK